MVSRSSSIRNASQNNLTAARGGHRRVGAGRIPPLNSDQVRGVQIPTALSCMTIKFRHYQTHQRICCSHLWQPYLYMFLWSVLNKKGFEISQSALKDANVLDYAPRDGAPTGATRCVCATGAEDKFLYV